MLVWISIRPINSPDKFLINETELFSINFQYFSQITHLSNFNILCQGNVDNKCNRLNQMCRKGVRNRMEGGGVIILSPSIFSKIDKIQAYKMATDLTLSLPPLKTITQTLVVPLIYAINASFVKIGPRIILLQQFYFKTLVLNLYIKFSILVCVFY